MAKRKPVGGRLRRKKRLRKKAYSANLKDIQKVLDEANRLFGKRLGLCDLLYGINPRK